MIPTPRATREPDSQEAADVKQVGEDLAAHFVNGIDRVAEVQKKCIDLAVQHELESVNIWKELTPKWSASSRVSGAPMPDLVASNIERFAEVQKNAIDFMAEQNKSLLGLMKDGAATLDRSKDSTANILQQAVEHTVAAQKNFLDQSANQTKAVFDATRQQFGLTGDRAEAVAGSFHRGVDTIVEAQKDLLDVVAH